MLLYLKTLIIIHTTKSLLYFLLHDYWSNCLLNPPGHLFSRQKSPRAATNDAALSRSRFCKKQRILSGGEIPTGRKNVRQESKNGRYSQMALITSLTTLKAISPMNTPMATSAALFGSISSSMDLSFCWLVVDIFDRFGRHVGWFAAQAIPSASW